MTAAGAITGRIDVGTYRLLMHCTGKGSPTVVLDGNLRGTSTEWENVRSRVSGFTRVCVYGREGIAHPPLTSARIARDLRTLLQETGVPGPYILVGWGFGAYTARMFASEYAAETAGLVLVEALHEEFFDRYRRIMPPAPSGAPDPLQDFRYELAGGYRYLADMEASAAQVSNARLASGELPLVIVTRGDPDWPNDLPPNLLRQLERNWQGMQAELLDLSSNSVQLVASRSGHMVQCDRPDVVVDAIRRVVDAVRDRAPVRGRSPARRH